MKRYWFSALTACAVAVTAQDAAAQTVLRFGKIPSTVKNVGSLYLHVAERKGFFAREGIKLQSVMIEGGTDRMVAAIDKGDIDLAHSSTPYLIEAVLKGSEAVGIAGEVGNPVYTLVVRPEITSYADLKGKLIALSVPADTIFQLIVARRAWAAANKDKMVPFVRAVGDAFRFIREPTHRAETIKLMMEQTGSSEDIAQAVMTLYFEPDRGVMPRQAEIDLKGLAQVIAFMGEAGSLSAPLPPVERFVDLQYLQAAGLQ